MKKFLVHIENSQYCGIWDDFMAFAESKDDNELLEAIENKYLEMYYSYGDIYDNYDDDDLNEEEFVSDMFYTIEEWNDEIEKDFKDMKYSNLIYNGCENYTN